METKRKTSAWKRWVLRFILWFKVNKRQCYNREGQTKRPSKLVPWTWYCFPVKLMAYHNIHKTFRIMMMLFLKNYSILDVKECIKGTCNENLLIKSFFNKNFKLVIVKIPVKFLLWKFLWFFSFLSTHDDELCILQKHGLTFLKAHISYRTTKFHKCMHWNIIVIKVILNSYVV